MKKMKINEVWIGVGIVWALSLAMIVDLWVSSGCAGYFLIAAGIVYLLVNYGIDRKIKKSRREFEKAMEDHRRGAWLN